MKRSADRRAGDVTAAFATVLPTPDGALRFRCISHQLQMPNVLIGASIIFSHDHPAPGSHAKYIFEQGQPVVQLYNRVTFMAVSSLKWHFAELC